MRPDLAEALRNLQLELNTINIRLEQQKTKIGRGDTSQLEDITSAVKDIDTELDGIKRSIVIVCQSRAATELVEKLGAISTLKKNIDDIQKQAKELYHELYKVPMAALMALMSQPDAEPATIATRVTHGAPLLYTLMFNLIVEKKHERNAAAIEALDAEIDERHENKTDSADDPTIVKSNGSCIGCSIS